MSPKTMFRTYIKIRQSIERNWKTAPHYAMATTRKTATAHRIEVQ